MRTLIQNLWAVPIFSEEEQARQAQLLHVMRQGLLLVLAGNSILSLLLLPNYGIRWAIIFAAGFTSTLVVLWFNQRGRTRLAGAFFILLIWAISTAAAFTAGGIRAPAAKAYFVIVLFAGLLFGGRTALIMGIVCGLSGGTLVALEAGGILTSSTVPHTSLSLWIIDLSFLAVIVIMVHLATRSTSDALRRAHVELQERVRAEAALRRGEELFRAIVEDQTEMIVRWKPDGTRTFMNQAYCRALGRDHNDLIHSNLLEGLSAPERCDVQSKVHFLTVDRPVATDVRRGALSTGRFYWHEWTDRAIFDASGQVVEFQSVGRDITERKLAELQREQGLIRERLAREDYTRQLISSQESERARISKELHDSIGQNLLLIKNRAQLGLADGAAPENMREQFEAVTTLATDAIDEVRQISHHLHPYQLDHLGFTRAVQAMVDNTTCASGIACHAKFDLVDDVLSPDAATNLYRIIQEALNNILKHARAGHIRISVERDIRELLISIEDDGVGFDTERKDAGGLGLRNISERVRILNGDLQLKSGTAGTSLKVRVPIAETA